ncbi:uncharacterized protein FTOL_06633 [Fusarium torulosum]|uniref:Uncharacterized protein n=1 Tax=Fusarium torulosum TaxID=33205 RepID=A0AAE8M9E5_9HYPO|nr:uncharacterized protein FTOL_06633 [Fusarium torulosum]
MSTPPETQKCSKGLKSPAKSPSSPRDGSPNKEEAVNEDDADSLTGQSLSSSTDSVTSSIFEYRKLFGRTFHHEIGNAQYCHHCLTLGIGGRLHLAPLGKDKITWGKLFSEGAKKFGMSFTVYEEELQKKAMEAAGFVDIQTHDFKVRESLASLNLEHRLQLDND